MVMIVHPLKLTKENLSKLLLTTINRVNRTLDEQLILSKTWDQYNLDSIDLVMLEMEIEDNFDIEFYLDEIESSKDMKTIHELTVGETIDRILSSKSPN